MKKKATTKGKRNIGAELLEAAGAMKAHLEGKLTLRTHDVEALAPVTIDVTMIRATREQLGMSQAVFAAKLYTKKRTLEKWEHGRATPNDQAAALIMLVRKYPDTIARLAKALSE